jgi:hypothetical protein
MSTDPLRQLANLLATPCDLVPLDGLVGDSKHSRELRSVVSNLSEREREWLAQYLCNTEQLNITTAMLDSAVLDALALIVKHRRKILPLLAQFE